MNTRFKRLGWQKKSVIRRQRRNLGIPKNTLYGWVRKARFGYIYLCRGTQSSESAMSLVEELNALRKKNRYLEKANMRLQEENEILADAASFFAAIRRKSGKTKE